MAGRTPRRLCALHPYLNGDSTLSICIQTKNGYCENCTVEMKSNVVSTSKVVSMPVFIKKESTSVLPDINMATLQIKVLQLVQNISRKREINIYIIYIPSICLLNLLPKEPVFQLKVYKFRRNQEERVFPRWR